MWENNNSWEEPDGRCSWPHHELHDSSALGGGAHECSAGDSFTGVDRGLALGRQRNGDRRHGIGSAEEQAEARASAGYHRSVRVSRDFAGVRRVHRGEPLVEARWRMLSGVPHVSRTSH